MMSIKRDRYAPVEIDQIPMPCPFCGGAAELVQLAFAHTVQGRLCVLYSRSTLVGEEFWFTCRTCDATTGGHYGSAQKAVEAWNRRQVQ